MASRSRNLLGIGLLANVFEWYEYSIFGFLAGLIGQLFFEPGQSVSELMDGLMLFSMSYLARPLGSLFFGLMGDRMGSASALRLSLILMTIPTALVGLLPTYRQVGITVTICLVVLRLIQGFAAGGELANSGCYVFETAPPHRRSLLCSCVMASSVIGMLLGSFVSWALFRLLDQASLLAWGWRIPFLLGIPLTLFIMSLRKGLLHSTNTHLPGPHHPSTSKGWAQLWYPLLKASCLVSFQAVFFYILVIWMPSYLKYFLGIPSDVAYLTNTLLIVMILPLYLLYGFFAQHRGILNFIIIGIIGILLFILPVFKSLQTQLSTISLLGLQLIIMPFFVSIHSVWVEMLIGLFPSSTRNLGVNLAWSLPPSLIGSTAPLVCPMSSIKPAGSYSPPSISCFSAS